MIFHHKGFVKKGAVLGTEKRKANYGLYDIYYWFEEDGLVLYSIEPNLKIAKAFFRCAAYLTLISTFMLGTKYRGFLRGGYAY